MIWLWQEEMLEEFFDNDGKFIGDKKSISKLGFESNNYFILIKGLKMVLI